MQMRRFFIDPAEITGNKAVISGTEARHARLVLRLNVGLEIELLDGRGAVYRAVIREISKEKITSEIINQKNITDNGPQIHFGQALLKGKKMDFLIQKATELGIHTIHPFTSAHCANLNTASRRERWNKISLEACKQCGRPRPPDCRSVREFSQIIRQDTDCKRKIIFWEKERQNSLASQISGDESILFLTGPEGGFSAGEISEAREHGFQTVTLGRRILRAETAAFCAMSIIQYLSGNLDY